ncbi:MAG: hypothetical protein ACOY94_13320 [Bacillota bacterium]
MQDWDRLVMVLLGGGVALHSCYVAWRLWGAQNRGGAFGSLFLALVAVALPVMLALSGG